MEFERRKIISFKKQQSKIFAAFLAVIMVVALMPQMSFAVDDTYSSVTDPSTGLVISVSNGIEGLSIAADNSKNTDYVLSGENGNFPQGFSLIVNDKTGVTVELYDYLTGSPYQNGNFEFVENENPNDLTGYGAVVLASRECVIVITKNGNSCSIYAPAPVNSQGGDPTNTGIAAYLPAAGQFVNSGITAGGWGDAFVAGTNPGLKNMVNSNSPTGVSLGAFGGYLVLDFGIPTKDQNGNVVSGIYNDADNKYGIDFILYGNAMANWAEPGCVQVSENGTDWYDIAGSLHYRNPEYSEGAVWDYSVKYTNTQRNMANDLLTTINPANAGTAESVPFTFTGKVRPNSQDIITGNGAVVANFWHQQCYFPLFRHYFMDRTNSNVLTILSGHPLANLSIAQNFGIVYTSGTANTPAEITLKGVKLNPNINAEGNPSTANDDFLFGYADSHQNGSVFGESKNPYETGRTSGGDPIDLDWAVNPDGTPIHLDSVRFVRIYTGVQQDNGMTGESSTEITGAYVAIEKGTQSSYDEIIIYDPTSGNSVETDPNGIPEMQIIVDDFEFEIQSSAENVIVNGKPLANNNGTFMFYGHMEYNTEELMQIIMQTGTSQPEIRIVKLIH